MNKNYRLAAFVALALWHERLPQYATERVLRERVAELRSVRVRYGWVATAVTQHEQGAHVAINEHRGSGSDINRLAHSGESGRGS